MYQDPRLGRLQCFTEGGSIADIEIFAAAACDDLLASEQVVWRPFIRLVDSTGQLGATVEVITEGE